MLFIDGSAVGSNSTNQAGLSDALLSPFGDGLFETMLLCEGRIHLQERHFNRLQQGANALGLVIELPQLEQELDQFKEHFQLLEACYRVRLRVQRGAGSQGYSVENLPVHRIISAHPISFPPTQAIRLTLSNVQLSTQPLLAGIKHCNRLEQILARAEIDSNQFDEALMSNGSGELVEGVGSNLYILEDGDLHTPPIEDCGVSGVARSWLLDHSASLGALCTESSIDLDRLLEADAVIMSNAISGFRQVRSYRDSIHERSWLEHNICRQIQSQFVASTFAS